MNRRRVALTAFLLTPFLLLGAVIWGISHNRPEMNAPPVGAGAGRTGGANAIGEYLAHGSAKPREEATPTPAPKAPEQLPERTAAPTPPPETAPPTQPPTQPDPRRTVYPRGTVTTISVAPNPGSSAPHTNIQVFTPPGYDSAAQPNTEYPVLYLIGDKVFDPEGWAADDIASEYMSKGLVVPAIIVAVPPPAPEVMRAKLEQSETVPRHRNWLNESVISSVSQAFRVSRSKQTTAIGGAGVNAVWASDAQAANPARFGLLLMQGEVGMDREPRTAARTDRPIRTYEGREADSGRTPADAQHASGLGPDRLLIVYDRGAISDPSIWRTRLPYALAFLFPTEVDSTK